jgi:hypothetical protein
VRGANERLISNQDNKYLIRDQAKIFKALTPPIACY